MGIFDGVLLVSDFDDTLVDRKKRLPERTKAALSRFVAQGGESPSCRAISCSCSMAPGWDRKPLSAALRSSMAERLIQLAEQRLNL